MLRTYTSNHNTSDLAGEAPADAWEKHYFN